MPEPTGGWNVVKSPQYVEEATYGVLPGTPTFNWIGIIGSWDPKADMRSLLVRRLGAEDLVGTVKGAEQYEAALDYLLQDSVFATYGVNAQGGGAGSIDKSLSILYSQKLSGTEYYVQLNGVRPNRVSLHGRAGEALRCRMDLWAQKMPLPSATGPTGATYATPATTNPWMFSDGGSNPVQWGSYNLDVREIEVEIARNLERVHVLGGSQVKYLPAKHREIRGTLTILWEDVNQYTDLTGDAKRNLTWVLKSAASTLTLTNAKLSRLESWRAVPTELTFERYGVVAEAASLT